MVISKYDSNGVVLWTKNFSGSYPVKPYDIKTDSAGNVIVIGEFSAQVDFDPSPTSSYNLGVQNYSQSPLFYFILKLNSSGNLVYAKEIGGSPRSLAVDSSQNIYITGTLKFTADFNPSPTATNFGNSADGYSIFITKLDANANFVWNKVIGKTTASPTGFADCGGNIIVNDASDNVLVSGYFTDNIDFDPGAGVTTYVAAGTTAYHIKNPFVLKLNSLGDFVWAKHFNATQDNQTNDMALDSSGNIYTTGLARGTLDFLPTPLALYINDAYYGTPYVTKIDSSGTIIWAKKVFSTSYTNGVNKIKIDNSGNIFSMGTFTNTLNYTTTSGTGTATTASYVIANVYLATLNSSGNLISFNHFGGVNETFPNDMVLKNNKLYLSGNFSATVDFDFTTATNTMTSIGLRDNFIAKYNISNFLNKVNFNKFTFKIYPNPTSDVVNLTFENNLENATLKITSILGQNVLELQNISGNNLSVEVSNLANGMYVIEIVDGVSKFNSKFIKQ